MKEFLQALSRGETLTTEQAKKAMHAIMQGKADPLQVAGLLMGLRARDETLTELTAFTRVMRSYAVPVSCDDPHAIDLCGTGGDGSGTFNISTAAAFVCAGAGITVAKHGNRGVSSKSGSADVLEALSVKIDLESEAVAHCLKKAGVGFIFARNYHPAMRHVVPIRRALASRTCFNILGPLCNPARVQRQIVGAFSVRAAEMMAGILANLGAEHVLAVSALDGMDEISLGATTIAFEYRACNAELTRREIKVEDHGLKPCALKALKGGTATDNAQIITAILQGESGPRRDVVVINSAYGLWVSGRYDSMDECLEAAQHSLDSGAADDALNRLREVSAAA